MNNPPIKESSTSNNTAVAITFIIVVGIWAMYKTHIDAKYNRETDISIDENGRFHLTSRPVTANNTSVCPA